MNFKFHKQISTRWQIQPKKVFLALGILAASGTLGLVGYCQYHAYQEEQQRLTLEKQRLAHLNVEALDLPFILNKVDELGGDQVQLHWKELTAIATIQVKNYPDQLTEDHFTKLADQFITEEKEVRSFEDVVDMNLQDVPMDPNLIDGLSRKEVKVLTKEREQVLEENEQFKTLAAQYLEDLTYIGYTPEKLLPEARETQFIESVKAGAIENYQQYGILPSITIAQAILESNWGTSELATEGKNLFGVKVGCDWKGKTISMETREYYDSWVQDQFRKYDTVSESILDHGKFLAENPRYEKAGVFDRKTYRFQAQALQDAGYSTDQDENGNYVYAEKLGALIRQYNLQLIDHEVLH